MKKRSLSDAQKECYWRIYAEFVQSLIQTTRWVRAGEKLRLDLDNIATCVNSGPEINGVLRNFRVHSMTQKATSINNDQIANNRRRLFGVWSKGEQS